MPVLESRLNPRSADFQANAQAMRTLVADLNAQITKGTWLREDQFGNLSVFVVGGESDELIWIVGENNLAIRRNPRRDFVRVIVAYRQLHHLRRRSTRA